MRSHWIRVGPNAMTGVPKEQEIFEETHMENVMLAEEVETGVIRLQSKECQGLLPQNLEEARKPPLEPSGRTWLCQHLDFKLLVFWTVREQISVVLHYPVCGPLLGEP